MTTQSKMGIRDLKKILMDKHGYTKQELQGENAKSLSLLLEEAEAEEDMALEQEHMFTEDADIEAGDEYLSTETDQSEEVGIYSEGWSEYVLDQLFEHEQVKIGKKERVAPTVDGLRRLTGKLLDDIQDVYSQVIQAPSPDNENRATVQVQVTLADGRRASGAADVFSGNVQEPFDLHPVATAETRAEGRAYKKLLHLCKVHTAEELDKQSSAYFEPAPDLTLINGHQIKGLETLCKLRVDVNIEKLVEKYYPMCNNINELASEEAQALFEIVSDFQQSGTPEDLQGYDEGWKQKLGVKE